MGVLDSILRTDLNAFIEKCFYTLEPNAEYLDNWHLHEIVRKLEAVESGQVKRLVINMPPRYLKSIFVSVGWSAWLLGKMPSRKIISVSHSNNLSIKHSLDVRKIMQSAWYKKNFPNFEFTPDQNEKHKFMSGNFGFRIASSVHSNITGEGADFIIVDDPQTPEQAFCADARKNVLRWFDQTLSTRLNNKKKGAIIVVAQRLHEDDLSGNLLKRGTWEHLCLPAVNDNGQLLHEEREGWEEIKRIKTDLGEYGFAAQYLQKPLSLDAGLVKPQWLKYYEALPEGLVYQSWDTAIKTGVANDYSVCITFVETAGGYYVADIFRDKLEYPELKRRINLLAAKWNPVGILVEDKASGQSLLQDLRRESKLPLIAQMPKNDKLQRLAAVTPLIEAGRLFLTKSLSAASLLELELCSFPDCQHDDMVDALTQFLNWSRLKKTGNMGIRRV